MKLPAGFIAREFSGPALANDIYALHVDADGRVAVSGRGYVRRLIDADGDGRANRAVELVAGLKDGPMGLLWEGDRLYVVADGGLKLYRGVTGEASAASAETVLPIRTAGEHDAHAVRRGPDGDLYLLCGNTAGVSKGTVRGDGSPVRDPVAGALLRIAGDGQAVHIVADGFRNPYDFDFSLTGQPYTFDSDNERCVGLPWYEPCRFYRVVPGGNYGWRNPQLSQTWRKPPYFPDVVAPSATLGRGSPTGVACYRHTRFPGRYHGGFFLADWTFGKVWFVPVTADDRVGKPEPFIEAVGESGFAPTGLAVHPKTGELFVSIGGRGTRGAVYRIDFPAGPPDARVLPIQVRPPTRPGPSDTPLSRVRQVQLAHGDLTAPETGGTVWEGYTFRRPPPPEVALRTANELRGQFPSGNADLDRELSRTLAALADPDPQTLRSVMAKLTETSDPVEDVHYLICLGRLPAPRSSDDTARTAAALLRLDEKYERSRLTRDRHWPLRLAEVLQALAARDPALSAGILRHPGFGRAEHVWLTSTPGMDRREAARRFVSRASVDPNYRWSPALVELLAALPDAEVRPLLPKLWAAGGLEDAAMPLIARNATPAQRERLIAGLNSVRPATVATAATSLKRLVAANDLTGLPSAVTALRRLGDGKPEAAARTAVVELLRVWTGEALGSNPAEWEAWLRSSHPGLAARLATPGYDPQRWRKRAAAIPWDGGDAVTGKAVFAKAQCAACHDGSAAVGPSLAGVAKRFGRDDLLAAVLDPDRDVSPRYRTVRFATDDDRTFDGVVIYEATDGVILQTGPDTTVRLAGDRIVSRTSVARSLMPAGLLDPLTDRQIADLFAYLKALGDRPPPP
ncbi:MAG: c-type cytochrome [Gemmataceae bacterium]